MKQYRHWGGCAALAALAALGLTACSGASAPHIASLGKKTAGHGSTTTLPVGTPAQLLDEWASCMRSHGDPDQVDPTVDTAKVIQITLGAGYAGGLRGESGACGSYLSAAQMALGGGPTPSSSTDATALRFAQCMRANGIPDYPDPTGTSSQAVRATPNSDLNPANPTFQSASNLCTNKTGYQSKFSTGPPQPGSINVEMAGGFGGKP